MGKKSKNPEKSQKFTFFSLNFFLVGIVFSPKKKYPPSFPILGGRDSTRALQSRLFQKYENLEKCQKIAVKKKSLKKTFPLSFPIRGGCDSTRALQSIPFQNPGGVP